MKQVSLAADTAFAVKRKTTRKQAFLSEMNQVVFWAELVAFIEPYTSKVGPKGGRPAFATERPCGVSIFCSSGSRCLTRPWKRRCMTCPLYRQFAGLDIGSDRLPDESTILRFRHLSEQHDLATRMFDTVSGILADKGLRRKAGTAVDATIIASPSSTKNSTVDLPLLHE